VWEQADEWKRKALALHLNNLDIAILLGWTPLDWTGASKIPADLLRDVTRTP
jgi:hypothetical protein